MRTDQIRTRQLLLQTLEPRDYLSGCNPLDVNDDNVISPLDALVVVQRLSQGQPCDVNGDGRSTPLDVLTVVNRLNGYGVTWTPQVCQAVGVIPYDASPLTAGPGQILARVHWEAPISLDPNVVDLVFEDVERLGNIQLSNLRLRTAQGEIVPAEVSTFQRNDPLLDTLATWTVACRFRTEGNAYWTTPGQTDEILADVQGTGQLKVYLAQHGMVIMDTPWRSVT